MVATGRLDDVLGGGLGHFWLVENFGINGVLQQGAQSGFVRRLDEALEVRLLVDDALELLSGRARGVPTAIAGATEHAGVLLLGLLGYSGNTNFGGGRASTAIYRTRSIALTPELFEITDVRPMEVGMRVPGRSPLGWAGLDPTEFSLTTHAGSNRIKRVDYALDSMPDQRYSIDARRELVLSSHWHTSIGSKEPGMIDLALAVSIVSDKPHDLTGFLEPLTDLQMLFSLVSGGHVAFAEGTTRFSGTEERATFWDTGLCANTPPPGVPGAAKSNFGLPLVSYEDLGGIGGLGRWIRLAHEHRSATRSIRLYWQQGNSTVEQMLVATAMAIEYWVAAHRRSTKWARAHDLKPLTAARRIGSHFNAFVGDARTWADEFWTTYNKLKHDPAARLDPKRVGLLAASGHVLMVCLLLDRVAGTKKPSRRICSGHHFRSLGERLREAT